jgi:hypothetical protein
MILMKKFILGLVLGLAIAIPVGAHAEVVSLVNQVVQGLFPVTVDNKPLGDAIVVDNKTYLPVREFGEAAGYKVTFTDDQKVILTKNDTTTSTTHDQQLKYYAEWQKKYNDLSDKLNKLVIEKQALETKIGDIKTHHETENQNTDDLQQQVADKQAQIDKLVEEKQALEAQMQSQQ